MFPQLPTINTMSRLTRKASNMTTHELNGSSTINNNQQPQIVELNVGGSYYTTTMSTLLYESDSLLTAMFTGSNRVPKDTRGRYFIDRDGILFRYILDYLRNNSLTLPKDFEETERLMAEAEFFKLTGMVKSLKDSVTTTRATSIKRYQGGSSDRQGGFITLCVRGTYAFGRDGIADIKFRKLQRILVCGNVALTRKVFQDSLNESRDPDRDTSSYSSRFFLKHPHLEQAFDRLHEADFMLVTSAAGGAGYDPESEETKWNHFTNYVFSRK